MWSYQTNQRYDTEWIIGHVSFCDSYQVQKAPFTYGNLIWDQSSYARPGGCVWKVAMFIPDSLVECQEKASLEF